MIKVKSKTVGGEKLRAHLRQVNAKRKSVGDSPYVEVGFFETAKYQNGVPVAAVAAWNEFGVSQEAKKILGAIPSRPFFREAIRNNKDKVKKILADADVLADKNVLEKVGEHMKGEITKSIVSGDWAPNAPYTVEEKGSSKPLIDTGLLRQSVHYEVRK